MWLVIEAARGAYGDDMAAFLCWLGVRLMEMHRVLRNDGSMYLHIDHTAHAYVKAMMDAIFGAKNFRNEIVWGYSGGGIPKADFPRKHDTLLRYTKTNKFTFHREYRPYGDHNTTGRRATTRGGTRKAEYRKEGTPITDCWTDVKPLINWDNEKVGYPTQKPLRLYERIIKASSNRNDVVLDPFAGCATTPIAAERLGRQWIGMDIWDGAFKVVMQRMEDNRQLITDIPEIHYSSTPPVRTDDNEVAAPNLRLRIQRPTEPWQRLSHNQMTNVLVNAQSIMDGVVCAGCGRILEREFMELDHITPKSDRGENHILNRIILCRPCNGRKGNVLTLAGLIRENKRVSWMQDERRANGARDRAELRAYQIRDEYPRS